VNRTRGDVSIWGPNRRLRDVRYSAAVGRNYAGQRGARLHIRRCRHRHAQQRHAFKAYRNGPHKKTTPANPSTCAAKSGAKSGAKIRRALGAAGGAGTGEIPADQACNWELERGCLPRPGACGVATKEGGRFFKPRAVRIYRRETAPTSLVPGRLWGQSANNGLGGGGAAQQPSLSLPVHRIIIC